MKILSLIIILSSFLLSQERFSQVEIPVSNAAEYHRLVDLGIAVDHFEGKIGTKISVFLSESELDILSKAGISFSYLIKDWKQYYDEQQRTEQPVRFSSSDSVPKYFRFGSMGGFLIYNEVLQQLDSMKLLFPNLITAKEAIGISIEGREIFTLKISDNPNSTETDEPEVLYTALHHAREPGGMMTVIYYMWWLLENYGKDPEATYLVNNRQMWFIPVVNPDGYNYNHSIAPSGGGMWRKNRRDNGNLTFGVDLNRNYGSHLMWNAPNGGSSATPSSDVYRGPIPFSEPETHAIADFLSERNIKTCFNYHTHSNLLIYPWGYSSKESSDSLLFRMWTYDMSMTNRYAIGTDLQTVGYSTRGNSDDFMYSDTGKPNIYAMTPEVGTTGFWPVQSLIYPQAQENILQNKLLAHFAGAYLSIKSFTVNSNSITVKLFNKGLAEETGKTIHLQTSAGTVSPSFNTGTIQSFTEKEFTVNYSALIVDGPSALPVKIILKDSTGGMLKDSITFIAGSGTILLNDSANTTTNWSTGTGWGLYNDGVTSNYSFSDSPNGNYPPNTDNSLTLISSIDLSLYQLAELKFTTKWSIESTWDFAVVEISTNNGTTWTSVKTQLSRKGSGRSGSKQPSTSFGYDAFTPGLDWIEQTADLSSFAGKQIKIRFRLSSDGADQRDGWYVDNIRVIGYKDISNSVAESSAPLFYSLSQNFPNPFNPATVIRYQVPIANHVSLKVFDVLGKEVETLVNAQQNAGNYSVNFNAQQLSSGIYFYRFTSGNYTNIKKMTVLK